MQGRAPDDELLAVAWSVCMARPKALRLTRAEAARQLGVTRPTVSSYLNAQADATRAAYERVAAAGRLPDALERFGFEVDDADERGPLVTFAISAPLPVTVELVEAAAQLMHRDGLPPLHALIVAGADEVDAAEWIEAARGEVDQRNRGWPADGWRLLRKVQAIVSGELLNAAKGGRAADFFRLGGILDPVLFAPEHRPEERNPLDDLSDDELVAVVGGDFASEPDE